MSVVKDPCFIHAVCEHGSQDKKQLPQAARARGRRAAPPLRRCGKLVIIEMELAVLENVKSGIIDIELRML